MDGRVEFVLESSVLLKGGKFNREGMREKREKKEIHNEINKKEGLLGRGLRIMYVSVVNRSEPSLDLRSYFGAPTEHDQVTQNPNTYPQKLR